jgi:septal ring factor EnvC (AmiA/AmiB activator)
MSDEELTQAMAELQEVVRCRCDEAYRDRGLKDPHCECDSAEAVKIVASRIKALTEQLSAARKDAEEAEAYAEEVEADRKKTYEALLKVSRIHGEVEAKLAKAVEALESLIQQTHDCEKELTEDLHHVDFCGESEPLTKARATLAEIKGESHE